MFKLKKLLPLKKDFHNVIHLQGIYQHNETKNIYQVKEVRFCVKTQLPVVCYDLVETKLAGQYLISKESHVCETVGFTRPLHDFLFVCPKTGISKFTKLS